MSTPEKNFSFNDIWQKYIPLIGLAITLGAWVSSISATQSRLATVQQENLRQITDIQAEITANQLQMLNISTEIARIQQSVFDIQHSKDLY